MALFKAEQHNPNDTEYLILSISKKHGDKVYTGDLLFELEGQKAVIEVCAPINGFIGFEVSVGDQFSIEDYLYCICDDPVEIENELKRIGADNLNLNIQVKPAKSFIEDKPSTWEYFDSCENKFRVAVVPGGKAYRQVEDALLDNHYIELVGYFDDQDRQSSKKLGDANIASIEEAWRNGAIDRVFVATGNLEIKKRYMSELSAIGLQFINVVHPSAQISKSASIGSNVFVGPNTIIGPKSVVGSGCFISAFSNIEHHCKIGNFCLFGPGVMLSGSVCVGESTVLGAGVAVESNISIGSGVYVSSGKGITKNLHDSIRDI